MITCWCPKFLCLLVSSNMLSAIEREKWRQLIQELRDIIYVVHFWFCINIYIILGLVKKNKRFIRWLHLYTSSTPLFLKNVDLRCSLLLRISSTSLFEWKGNYIFATFKYNIFERIQISTIDAKRLQFIVNKAPIILFWNNQVSFPS